MYAPERQRIIVEQARQEGNVSVLALAETLDVTPETIRRDLTFLEQQGVLRRVHGGAIPTELLDFAPEPDLSLRTATSVEEKQRIAEAALAYLPERGTVLLDAGSSTALLAQLLVARAERHPLVVVTHSLPIAASLAGRPGISLHIIGGQVREVTQAAVGPWTLAALGQIAADVAFLGTNGVSARGISTPDVAEAEVKRAIVASAHRAVVLADHTKFGREDFSIVAPLNAIDAIVTDTGVDTTTVDEYAELGPEVVTA